MSRFIRGTEPSIQPPAWSAAPASPDHRKAPALRLTFCGVRGSTPSPGPDYVRYGGHTSCVAIASDGGDPALLLDGGTGLQRLTSVLDGRPFRGTLLLGHLHWDHTHGIPFFRAGALRDSRVDVRLPDQRADGQSAEDILGRAFSPPHFPIGLPQLGAGWSFAPLCAGSTSLEGFDVLALDIPHKGGRTFGFRIGDGARSIAYLSDHSPIALGPGPDGVGSYHPAALRLAQDVDLLIHDAQHVAAEFPAQAYLGHSTVDYAVGLAARAGARRLGLFHHAPSRTDDEIDAIVAGQRDAPVAVEALAEGRVIDLPANGGG